MGNVDRFASACGEADVQPSLLPVNHTTGISLCQALFCTFFMFFLSVNILFPDGYNHAVGSGPGPLPTVVAEFGGSARQDISLDDTLGLIQVVEELLQGGGHLCRLRADRHQGAGIGGDGLVDGQNVGIVSGKAG